MIDINENRAFELGTGFRICTVCGESKPNTAEFFSYKDTQRKPGKLRSVCRKCCTELQKVKKQETNPLYRRRKNNVIIGDGGVIRRTCTCCHEVKLATTDFFSPLYPLSDGKLSACCRVCSNKKSRKYRSSDPAFKVKSRIQASKYRRDNPEEIKANQKKWRETHKEEIKRKNRRSRIKKYGLEPEDYERMLVEQNNQCAICGDSWTPTTSHDKLCIDHDHESGVVRALLCQRCNRALGDVREDIRIAEAVVAFLKFHKDKP
jgi:hypothetical protein